MIYLARAKKKILLYILSRLYQKYIYAVITFSIYKTFESDFLGVLVLATLQTGQFVIYLFIRAVYAFAILCAAEAAPTSHLAYTHL